MKISRLSSTIFPLLASATLTFEVAHAALPAAWIRHPEDLAQSQRQEALDLESSSLAEQDALMEIRKIVRVNTDSLDEAGPALIGSNRRWGLARMSTEIGITHGGMLGLLPFKGTAAATIWYQPKTHRTNDFDEKSSEFDLHPDMSEASLRKQVRHIRDFVIATKRVTLPSSFERDLFGVAKRFLEVAEIIRQNPHPYWRVHRFFLDQVISASGSIVPIIDPGAMVRLRLVYNLSNSSPRQARSSTDKSRSLENLINWLADDLTTAAANSPISSEFQASSFRIGLGVGLKTFGLSKVNYEAIGHLEFRRTPRPLPSPDAFEINADADQQDLVLFDHSPTSQEVHYAQRNGLILKASDKDGDKIVDDIAYRLNRTKLRRGLSYSFQMGKKMAKFAEHSGQHWRTSRVDATFNMGVGGSSIISLLNRSSTTVISFTRGNP